MPSRRRPHERGLAAEALARVDGRAVLEQRLRGRDVAGARDGHQRRLAVLIRRVRVRSGREQQVQDLGVRDLGREAHRRRAVLVREIRVGAVVEQPAYLCDVAFVDGPLQRRAAVGVAMIHVRGGRRRRVDARGQDHERGQHQQRGWAEDLSKHRQTSEKGPVLSPNFSYSFAGMPARSSSVTRTFACGVSCL